MSPPPCAMQLSSTEPPTTAGTRSVVLISGTTAGRRKPETQGRSKQSTAFFQTHYSLGNELSNQVIFCLGVQQTSYFDVLFVIFTATQLQIFDYFLVELLLTISMQYQSSVIKAYRVIVLTNV